MLLTEYSSVVNDHGQRYWSFQSLQGVGIYSPTVRERYLNGTVEVPHHATTFFKVQSLSKFRTAKSFGFGYSNRMATVLWSENKPRWSMIDVFCMDPRVSGGLFGSKYKIFLDKFQNSRDSKRAFFSHRTWEIIIRPPQYTIDKPITSRTNLLRLHGWVCIIHVRTCA